MAQASLWFVQRLHPQCVSYNMATALTLHFPVDVAMMARAAALTVAGNDLLRSVYRLDDGEVRRIPVQPADVPPTWEVADATTLDEPALRRRVVELARQPFHLERELPIRFHLLRRERDDVLLLAAHHLIVDDVGQLAIVRALLSAYTGSPSPEPAEDFDDFVMRQCDYLTSARARAAESYWRNELSGLVSPAPLDQVPRPAEYRYEGAEIVHDLTPELSAAIRAAADTENVTAFVYLMTVFQVLLYSSTGRTDFLVGYPASQRSGRRFASCVGYFVNTLPLRATIDPHQSFQATLRRTNERFWRGLMHRDYPAALIPRLVAFRPDRRLPGLVSVLFGANAVRAADPLYEGLQPGRRGRYSGLELSRFDFPEQLGQFDINVLVTLQGDTTRVRFKYNTSVLSHRSAGELADEYHRLLEKATSGTIPSPLRALRT